jgi:hypothetical protein
MQQVPAPPVPQWDPNLLWLSEGGPPAIVVIVTVSLLAATIILWPVMRAFARRIEGKSGRDLPRRAEVEELQHRLGEVNALHVRLAELEERLDFAERLLASKPGDRPGVGQGRVP